MLDDPDPFAYEFSARRPIHGILQSNIYPGSLAFMRRPTVILLASLAASVCWVSPASADSRLGVGNPGQSSLYTLIRPGEGLHVTVFSGSGPAHGPGLQVDLSGLASDISVTADGKECVRMAKVIECGQIYSLVIEPGQGTGPGQAGRITVRNTTSAASITVDILTDAKSTLAGNDVTVTGRIGDVVRVPVSVRNEGPNTVYSGGISAISFEDNTKLVSIDGCQPGPLECTRTNFRAGTAIRITLHLRIVGCDSPGASGGYAMVSNPGAKFSHGRFKVKVVGCGGGTQGGQRGGSTQSDPAPTTPEALPTATSPVEQSIQVAGGTESSESIFPGARGGSPTAAGQKQSSSWLLAFGGTAVTMLGVGAFGLFAYRRRRQVTTDDGQESSA